MQISKTARKDNRLSKIKNAAEQYLKNSRYIILPETLNKSELNNTIRSRLKTTKQFAVHYLNIISSDEYDNILSEINSFAEFQNLENPDDRIEIERKVEAILDKHAKFIGCITEKEYLSVKEGNNKSYFVPKTMDFAITKLNSKDKRIVCDYNAYNVNLSTMIEFLTNYCYNKEILINACLDKIKTEDDTMNFFMRSSGITDKEAIIDNLNDSLSGKPDTQFRRYFNMHVKERNIDVNNAYNEFNEFIENNRDKMSRKRIDLSATKPEPVQEIKTNSLDTIEHEI